MSLYATVLTLFPEMFPGPLGFSLTGQALAQGQWQLETIDIREFGIGKHRQVDDTPYGGGAGMVMRPDVLDAAIQAALKKKPNAQLIYFTPKGRPLNQGLLQDLGSHSSIILLCGRFEAIDERVIEKHHPLEVSLGDFVMTGGELAAMALLDGCVRLLPGVIGDNTSLQQESFGLSQDYACLLEHPHYTRPPIWEERPVPDVLLSGHHGDIARWRKAESEAVTQARRLDLWKRYKEGIAS